MIDRIAELGANAVKFYARCEGVDPMSLNLLPPYEYSIRVPKGICSFWVDDVGNDLVITSTPRRYRVNVKNALRQVNFAVRVKTSSLTGQSAAAKGGK